MVFSYTIQNLHSFPRKFPIYFKPITFFRHVFTKKRQMSPCVRRAVFHEGMHTHTGTCVDGRVCCCLVVVVCVFVLTLTVVRVVVVVVVVGGGVAPKPPRLVWDGCRTSASSM